MHDPTRGGVATTCHEVATRTGLRMVLEESALPVRGETATICELLGLDPLYLACEGRALIWVAGRDAARLHDTLRTHPLGRDAAVLGRVEERAEAAAPVVLQTEIGGARPIDLLSGGELPRIC